MPVIDVSVIKATDIVGFSGKKSYCVYVRLQGQAMRTNTCSGRGEARFNERFRFNYRPGRQVRKKNYLFVEVWRKSLLSQSCVSVSWIDMDEQTLVQGRPVTYNLHGEFEGRYATVTIVVVPVDFSTQSPQSYQPDTPANPVGNPVSNAAIPGNMYGQPPAAAMGVPLEPVGPYTTAQYTTGGQPAKTLECDAAPMPPADVLANATQAPPLFGANMMPPPQQQQPQQPQPYYGDYPPPKAL